MIWLILLVPFMVLLGVGMFIDRKKKKFKQNSNLTENQTRAKEDIERYKDMNQNDF